MTTMAARMTPTLVFSHANGFPAGTYRKLFAACASAGWIEGSHLFPMERPLEAAAAVLKLLGPA